MFPPPRFVQGPNGRLAVRSGEGRGPGLLWLPGFGSDMHGTKAEAVAAHAAATGRAVTRFDYSGLGESDGAFLDGTIGRWAADAEFILRTVTDGPQLLIASSMGAWIAGLLARQHAHRLAGLILIAPAPDFTEALIRPRLSTADAATLARGEMVRIARPDGSEAVYWPQLFVDGARHSILRETLTLPCPVRILAALDDDIVPAEHVLRFARQIAAPDMRIIFHQPADHRLSAPADIDALLGLIDAMPGP